VPEKKKPTRPEPGEEREIDYLICRECDTPCYDYQMEKGRLIEAICPVCGNEDVLLFQLTEDEDE
jgi:hypothetical protein